MKLTCRLRRSAAALKSPATTPAIQEKKQLPSAYALLRRRPTRDSARTPNEQAPTCCPQTVGSDARPYRCGAGACVPRSAMVLFMPSSRKLKNGAPSRNCCAVTRRPAQRPWWRQPLPQGDGAPAASGRCRRETARLKQAASAALTEGRGRRVPGPHARVRK